jgi:hypothetical protein
MNHELSEIHDCELRQIVELCVRSEEFQEPILGIRPVRIQNNVLRSAVAAKVR